VTKYFQTTVAPQFWQYARCTLPQAFSSMVKITHKLCRPFLCFTRYFFQLPIKFCQVSMTFHQKGKAKTKRMAVAILGRWVGNQSQMAAPFGFG
jgi:hypothetical protein